MRGEDARLYHPLGETVAVEDAALFRFFAGFEGLPAHMGEEAAVVHMPICARGLPDGSSGADDGKPLLCIERTAFACAYGMECLHTTHPAVHICRSMRDREAVLLANEDFSRVTLCGGGSGAAEQLALVAWTIRAATRGYALVHGAVVAVSGEGGILFIGPPGVGKTTQARLWETCRGAVILNGDRVFLQCDGRCVWVFGSPWSGSSPYRVQGFTRLRACVVLHRADHDSMRRMSVSEAAEAWLARTILPGFCDALGDVVGMATDTILAAASVVPVYAVSCRNDVRAVEALEREMAALAVVGGDQSDERICRQSSGHHEAMGTREPFAPKSRRQHGVSFGDGTKHDPVFAP